MKWIYTSNGWKWICAITYVSICIFDFIIVPIWFGAVRANYGGLVELVQSLEQLDPSIQLEVIRSFTFQHEPFTLKNGGLFHIAFGALLTGSAIVGHKKEG